MRYLGDGWNSRKDPRWLHFRVQCLCGNGWKTGSAEPIAWSAHMWLLQRGSLRVIKLLMGQLASLRGITLKEPGGKGMAFYRPVSELM